MKIKVQYRRIPDLPYRNESGEWEAAAVVYTQYLEKKEIGHILNLN